MSSLNKKNSLNHIGHGIKERLKMKTIVLLGTILISGNLHSQTVEWYDVPMNTVKDFENIPKRSLEETWDMTKVSGYHVWTKKNLQKARDLGWRPGHHRPDGTCYACHALKPATYERLKRHR